MLRRAAVRLREARAAAAAEPTVAAIASVAAALPAGQGAAAAAAAAAVAAASPPPSPPHRPPPLPPPLGANLLAAPVFTQDSWTIVRSGGNGCRFDNVSVQASYDVCEVTRDVALSELGYTDAYVDAHHPTIAFEVTIEHSEGRGDLAQYRFALVGANGSEVVGAGSDGWISLDRARRYAASFSSYGAGVRAARVTLAGKDREHWAGYFGTVFSALEIRAELRPPAPPSPPPPAGPPPPSPAPSPPPPSAPLGLAALRDADHFAALLEDNGAAGTEAREKLTALLDRVGMAGGGGGDGGGGAVVVVLLALLSTALLFLLWRQRRRGGGGGFGGAFGGGRGRSRSVELGGGTARAPLAAADGSAYISPFVASPLVAGGGAALSTPQPEQV